MTKILGSEVQEVCNLSKGVEEKGIAIGVKCGIDIGIKREREESTLRSIENLMETLNLSAEQAMAALKVPEADKPKYVSKLNQ